MPCCLQVAVLYMRVNGVGERRDVGDGDGPLIGLETCGFADEAELERAMVERPKMQVAFGVPLNPGRSTLQLALPRGTVGVEPALVVGQAGVFQCPLEACTGDLDSEDGLLPGLAAPAAAVHHPQERRLYPCHPVPLPCPGEAAIPGGRQADFRGVGLVDGDCGVRVQGSNLVFGFCHGDQSGPTVSRAPPNYRGGP